MFLFNVRQKIRKQFKRNDQQTIINHFIAESNTCMTKSIMVNNISKKKIYDIQQYSAKHEKTFKT